MLFVCGLTIALYFLRLMGDGRRLEERLRLAGPALAEDAQECELPLFSADRSLWTAPFFIDAAGPAGPDGKASPLPGEFQDGA